MTDQPGNEVTRRGVLAGTAAVALTALPEAGSAASTPAATRQDGPVPAPVLMPVSFEVNGQAVSLTLDTRTSLLDALREHLQLTGTKKGCDHGQCGACTIMLDGQRINACLTLAVMHQGSKITTIEGLGTPDNLHPMQAAFIKHDGYQCGYCTPGQICSAVGMLAEVKANVPSFATSDLSGPIQATDAEIRERMSGNLCRCGAYSNILDALNEVKGELA
ncbi:MAG: aldehyde dehydrogenase iron-sulfur subunit PaoA [Acetobacteraceae bacterium]|nr:aldehyde dehydrogenase iron-sulfur subunit PaoA [Acetobacteraceae bacterium]